MSLYSTKLYQLYSFIPRKILLSRNLKNRFLNRLCRFIAVKICLYRKNVTKLDQLYRFIPGKIILSRNLCRFIKGIHKFGSILSLHGSRKIFVWFSIASSVTKKLANKIVSLYSIFFSKIVYLYCFKRLQPAALAGDFGWRLWPATLALDGDFGRRLWPATLASDDFDRRLWPTTSASDFGR